MKLHIWGLAVRRTTVRGDAWGNRSERYINVAIKCWADEIAGKNESETKWIMSRQSMFKGSG